MSVDVEAEVEKISEGVLNKVSNLKLVNIVYLRAMDWENLQCLEIRASIAWFHKENKFWGKINNGLETQIYAFKISQPLDLIKDMK